MIYGYARVSTVGQANDGNGLEVQEHALRSAGAEMIYSDRFSGTKRSRPQFDILMSSLAAGDTLIVAKLDRMARSTQQGLDIITDLKSKGVIVNILNMGGIIDDSPVGQLMMTMLFAFAQFERDMIVQRTAEGKCIAKQRPGFTEGRPRKNLTEFEKFAKKQKDGQLTVNECCEQLGISRSTWYNRVRTEIPA